MENEQNNTTTDLTRCVIVVDKKLSVGHSANAAAVMAITVGHRYPNLIGESYLDASGTFHHGLVSTGVPILGAERDEIQKIRNDAVRLGCDVVDFPVEGQQTTNYAQFRETVAGIESPDYLAVALIGPKKPINKAVGRLRLL